MVVKIKLEVSRADVKRITSLFDSISIKSKGIQRLITDRIGRRIKREINKQIDARPYHQKWLLRRHNTPQSLKRTLHFSQVSTGRLEIWMQRRGRGVDPNWVEYGTKAHFQPNNPFFGAKGGKAGIGVLTEFGAQETMKRMHPGATPTHFFQRAWQDIQNSDILDKAAIEALDKMGLTRSG